MLTKRERQVLEMRRKGMKQTEIAAKLNTSQPVISSFESNAMRKIRDAAKVLEFVKENGIKYEMEE